MELYSDTGAVGLRLKHLEKLLLRPGTKAKETLVLRGEHRGLCGVWEIIQQLYDEERDAGQGVVPVDERMRRRLQRGKKAAGLA